MQITSNIYRIDGVIGANSYLVITKNKMLVIDTGMPRNENRIVNFIRKLDRNPSDVEYIVLTHADMDHVGSTAGLKNITGAKVAIHENDASILSGEKSFKVPKGLTGSIARFFIKLMHIRPVRADVLLKHGDMLPNISVIHTPGHTAGSICLYTNDKAIFVGDVLRCNKQGNPITVYGRLTNDREQAKKSVALVSSMDFNILLPGHGPPVSNNAGAKVKELII